MWGWLPVMVCVWGLRLCQNVFLSHFSIFFFFEAVFLSDLGAYSFSILAGQQDLHVHPITIL